MLASTAKPSPPTKPSAMQRRTTVSNSSRRRSASRNRPWRVLENDVQHAVIVDVEPSTAVRQAEVTAAKTMIERAHDDLDLWPVRLIADTGYGSAEMLNWLVNDRGIEPHIPVFDKSKRPTKPSRAKTLSTTTPVTPTAVQAERPSGVIAESSRCRGSA